MDSLRGKFGFSDGVDDDTGWDDADHDSELAVDDTPPAPVGQDERRMQVRAYNYWASLLGERTYPSVEDIEPETLPDFAENSVLLDFTGGIENPAIAFLGDRLASECEGEGPIESLADVPSRSLLSRITDHYMQILANEAPVGFEAEFINQRGLTILYRGILLPFSTDDDTIDFIYGVINWKEVADQLTTDALLLEIDQALDNKPRESDSEDADGEEEDAPLPEPQARTVTLSSITRWADGPGAVAEETTETCVDFPAPSFARLDAHLGGEIAFGDADENDDAGENDDAFDPGFDPLADMDRTEVGPSLLECLAEARALADAANGAEVRSRVALYRAVGRAYDVGLAALAEPDAFERLLDENAISAVPRAPLTPVVKLVFGADYDKTRVAEYAAVLSFAQRSGVGPGELFSLLEETEGGIKEIVARERAARRNMEPARPANGTAASRTRARLDRLEGRPLDSIPGDGEPYSLCLIRREGDGEIAFIGEISGDDRLLARAAKRLTD